MNTDPLRHVINSVSRGDLSLPRVGSIKCWLSLAAGILLMLGGLKLAFWPGVGVDSFASSKTLVDNPIDQSALASSFDSIIDDDPTSDFVKVAIPIEQISLGQRSAGQNPLSWQVSDEPEPTPQTHREVRFEMRKPSGQRLWMRFIWSVDQIAASGAAPGKTIHFDLEEMAISGDATCTYVGPCPEIQSGPGNVVTGLFEHETDPGSKIFTIALADGTTIAGVTANHPIWSVDQGDFVPAEHLRTGTMLLTRAGPTAIESITSRPTASGERVYNLQIQGEHVYEVTARGILVHNNCDGPQGRLSQLHHFATNKSKTYTPKMKEIADRYGLGLDDVWNKEILPHLGRHPNNYHDFVLDGMGRAELEAGTSQAKFIELFEKYVKEPIRQNPDLLRKIGWE